MSTVPITVVAIEDDTQIRRFLKISFEQQGYNYIEAVNGKEGVRLTASHNPDLLIVDLGLPDIDGLEVIKQVREWSNVPIIVLSARNQEKDKVAALDAGADDYLTKPFGVDELKARLRVALRHMTRRSTEIVSALFKTGELEVDLAARIVKVSGKEVHLTPIEFKLLALLIRHAGKVLTHRLILKEVWGPNSEYENQYLRVYMNQLRHKIEAEPARPKYLITETGVGYRLKVE